MIIETPAMILDLKKIKKNIEVFQKFGNDHKIKLRPHIKTHKMPEIAKLQVKYGAVGITCASLSEAECMQENGLDDIFIAYPIIGKSKIEKLLRLCENGRVIVGIDSREGAIAISDAAGKRGVKVEVRLEIDTGMNRTGIPWENAAYLAQYVHSLPNIVMNGIFTYKGAVYQGIPTADNLSAAREESSLMAVTARKIKEVGVPVLEVSGGSSATAEFAGAEAGLTEIRPGAYVLGDMKRVKIGAMDLSNCAAHILVTVISTPTPERAIIDGGSKAFSDDVKSGTAPLYIKGCGHIEGISNDKIVFKHMSEEHGVLETEDGSPTGLRIGQLLKIIPNHCCTSLNLFNHVYIMNEDGSIRKEKVLARGMSY